MLYRLFTYGGFIKALWNMIEELQKGKYYLTAPKNNEKHSMIA
jgi:hypothetical protein